MGLLEIGKSGLLSTQTALSTVSNNISNVNTDGYTRQRADLVSTLSTPKGSFSIGAGVTVNSIQRIYNQFLTEQVQGYTSQSSEANTYLSYAQQVDSMLGNSSLSINSGMDDFFKSVQSVSNDPTSIAARETMVTKGQLLANRFNTLNQQLDGLQTQANSQIKTSIEQVNTLSQNIADLNYRITTTNGSGGNPNELLDKRDLLVSKLSSYVSVNTAQQSDGSLNVYVGSGQSLITGATFSKLAAQQNATDPSKLDITYGASAIKVTNQISGGSLGGDLKFSKEIIDPTRESLNTLAKSVVTSFNNANKQGVDFNGAAGGDLFDATGLTAASIKFTVDDPKLIAASSTTNPGIGNNENALAFLNLQKADNTVVLANGSTRSFSDQYSATVTDVATRTSQASSYSKTQSTLLSQASSQASSVSGVNLDEEAANLIKFQQAYQAASKIISASQTTFNSLISVM